MIKKLKTLELFGGIGAPRSALENLGVDIKAIDYVEILANAVKAYNSMYNHDYKEQSVLDWNLNVDLLVHGSPCQDFSVAGKNDMSSGRSILYERTLEIIEKELNPRPKYVVWENVTGLLSKANIKHFNHYLDTMEKLGYTNSYKIIKGYDVGVPHNRPRVFVVSIRNDLGRVFDFDNLEQRESKNVKEFLETEVDEYYNVTQPSMISAIEQKKVNIICNGVGTVTTKQVRWNNAGIVVKDKRFYDLKHDFNTINIHKFRELYPDFKEDFRYLTERECWRLLGYKDSQFNAVTNAGIKRDGLYYLAGNSIIVDVLEVIFKELLKGEVE